MSEEKKQDALVSRKSGPGLVGGITRQIRLVLRLMADSRVNFMYKLLPIGTVFYFIFPDILPGPIDDAIVLGVGTYMFIELCPSDVVEEHRAALDSDNRGASDDVVDADFSNEDKEN